MPDIYGDIAVERVAQDHQWGGPKHDDKHEAWHWLEYMNKQAKLYDIAYRHDDWIVARSALVKLAALAVAAIEQIDRVTGDA